jgi:hypothetical protein
VHPERAKPPSVQEYVVSAYRDWGTRVTGILSIPFTVAALMSASDYAKPIFVTLALICFVLTVYFVWARERERVQNLEESADERERRLITRDVLAALASDGYGITYRLASDADHLQVVEDFNDWHRKVFDHLRSVDQASAASFLSSSPAHLSVAPPIFGGDATRIAEFASSLGFTQSLLRITDELTK